MVPGALPRADLWLPFQGDRARLPSPRGRFGSVWLMRQLSVNRYSARKVKIGTNNPERSDELLQPLRPMTRELCWWAIDNQVVLLVLRCWRSNGGAGDSAN
jgi:hypothetical protein